MFLSVYRPKIFVVEWLTSRVLSGSRTNNFIVGLSNTSPQVIEPIQGSYTVCRNGPVKLDGETIYVRCAYNQLPARYVIIQLPHTEFLNFCELEIYGEGKRVHVLILLSDVCDHFEPHFIKFSCSWFSISFFTCRRSVWIHLNLSHIILFWIWNGTLMFNQEAMNWIRNNLCDLQSNYVIESMVPWITLYWRDLP